MEARLAACHSNHVKVLGTCSNRRNSRVTSTFWFPSKQLSVSSMLVNPSETCCLQKRNERFLMTPRIPNATCQTLSLSSTLLGRLVWKPSHHFHRHVWPLLQTWNEYEETLPVKYRGNAVQINMKLHCKRQNSNSFLVGTRVTIGSLWQERVSLQGVFPLRP